MFAEGSKERLQHISHERSATRLPWRALLFDDPESFDRNNIERALWLLQQESRARRPLLRDDCRLPVGFLAGAIVSIVLLSMVGDAKSAGLPAVLILGLAMFMIGLTRLATSRRPRDAVHRLTQYDDLRSIEPLLEAIHWPETDVRLAARATLLRLLPKLRTSDAQYFDVWWHLRLCRGLKTADPSLALAVLTALEQVGDERAVPYIEPLASGIRKWKAEDQIREAASACLDIVRDRKPPPTIDLLRPAYWDLLPAQSLLRSTSSVDIKESELLVRPIELA